MGEDLQREGESGFANTFGSLRPPPVAPFLFKDVVYNELCIAVSCAYLGDESEPTLTTYGANTSYPGSGIQNMHRDAPGGEAEEWEEGAGRGQCPGLVVNVPLQDFTATNGATRLVLASHEEGGTREDEEACSSQPTPRRGDIVLRDLRLRHGGMPNATAATRTMLAMVHIAARYRGPDEVRRSLSSEPVQSFLLPRQPSARLSFY